MFEDLCSPPASASSGYHFLTRCFSTALICAGITPSGRVDGVMARRWRHGGYALRHDAVDVGITEAGRACHRVDGVRAAPNSRQWRRTTTPRRRRDGVNRVTLDIVGERRLTKS